MSDDDDDRTQDPAPEPVRRDFLTLLTVATAAAGAGAFAWPFLDSLNPAGLDDGTAAMVDVDVGRLAPGQQIVVVWGGRPVLVVRRTPEALRLLQDAALRKRLRDPDSAELQQPSYATNWHRSAVPEFGVMVGVCTHLGCVPRYRPQTDAAPDASGWPGGYACPCHGSRFDLAGRVFVGAPAQYNLPVPPYSLSSSLRLRIGDDTQDPGFAFDNIRQI